MSRGIIAIGIDKDDELVKARITDGSQIVFLATHLGMAIRFDENDVRSMGRPAYGVRGIDLAKNDYVVGVAVTPKEHEPGEYRILPSPKTASASAPMWSSTACKPAAARASRTWPSRRASAASAAFNWWTTPRS
jgi:DNA gyrase/topoisomerase IV subunit A